MYRAPIAPGCLALLAVAGCLPTPADNPPPPNIPQVSRPDDRVTYPAPGRPTVAKVSWETERDQKFAEFLRDHSGGMIQEASVGIEKAGVLQVILDRSVVPEDTLALTKSLMAGARKDFPDRPINMVVFDPGKDPILKARFRPGQGVNYEIAHEKHGAVRSGGDADRPSPSSASSAPRAADPISRSGVTEADRKFAAWAEAHGKAYLRYVESDLEKHGRLWFGVTSAVKPADVPELTRSLLEGARKEFPRGELVAKVFDPEGEPIGLARLGADGKVRWEK